jgi:uncharacterized lipoprotein YajG
MKHLFAAVSAALIFTSCAEPPRTAVLRVNGDRVTGNAVLEHTYRTDYAVCMGERQKAALSGVTAYGGSGGLAGIIASEDRSTAADQVLVGCLAQKGYVIVPEAEADAKSAQFRAIADAAKRQGIATGSVR